MRETKVLLNADEFKYPRDLRNAMEKILISNPHFAEFEISGADMRIQDIFGRCRNSIDWEKFNCDFPVRVNPKESKITVFTMKTAVFCIQTTDGHVYRIKKTDNTDGFKLKSNSQFFTESVESEKDKHVMEYKFNEEYKHLSKIIIAPKGYKFSNDIPILYTGKTLNPDMIPDVIERYLADMDYAVNYDKPFKIGDCVDYVHHQLECIRKYDPKYLQDAYNIQAIYDGLKAVNDPLYDPERDGFNIKINREADVNIITLDRNGMMFAVIHANDLDSLRVDFVKFHKSTTNIGMWMLALINLLKGIPDENRDLLITEYCALEKLESFRGEVKAVSLNDTTYNKSMEYKWQFPDMTTINVTVKKTDDNRILVESDDLKDGLAREILKAADRMKVIYYHSQYMTARNIMDDLKRKRMSEIHWITEGWYHIKGNGIDTIAAYDMTDTDAVYFKTFENGCPKVITINITELTDYHIDRLK